MRKLKAPKHIYLFFYSNGGWINWQNPVYTMAEAREIVKKMNGTHKGGSNPHYELIPEARPASFVKYNLSESGTVEP